MEPVDLLFWKLRISKMNRDQLEDLVETMTDRTGEPTLSVEYMDRLSRQSVVLGTQAMLAGQSARKPMKGRSVARQTAKLDLSGYYAALDADEAEAIETADREAIRNLALNRLETFCFCESVRQRKTSKSPLDAYIERLSSQK